MKLYQVLTSMHTTPEALEAMGIVRGLVSYWDVLKGNSSSLRFIDYFGRHDLFVDSGAFAAFTQGVSIMEEYGRFLLEVRPQVYANLDVIRDAKATSANQAALERMGLEPLPVFHLGENLALLDAMLERHDYIALGVAQKQGTATGKHFLAECFARIVRRWPKRVHGFGITSQDLLERFPFYSTDSSAADKAGAYGRVMRWERGRLNYSNDLGMIPHLMDRGGVRVNRLRKRANMVAMLALESYITRLWERRGIAWT